MANIKKFKRDEVVKAASDLFWKKGFHATSTRDLQDCTNLRPGSIYASFGSKEGLYCEALEMYVANLQVQFESHLEKHEKFLDGLEAFVVDIVINQRCSNPSEVCMLIKSSSEFVDGFERLRSLTRTLSNDFEKYLMLKFEGAIKTGEVTNQDPLHLAQLFQIQLTGIRAYSHRSDDDTLRALIRTMMKGFMDKATLA